MELTSARRVRCGWGLRSNAQASSERVSASALARKLTDFCGFTSAGIPPSAALSICAPKSRKITAMASTFTFGDEVIAEAQKLRESGLDANQIAGILCKKDPQGKNYGIGIL